MSDAIDSTTRQHAWNDAESLDRPHPRSVKWWRYTEAEGWTHHERLDRPHPVRALRGSQDYAGLHLGRGTKWIK